MPVEFLLLAAAPALPPPASCDRTQPFLEVEIIGFKDRKGLLRVELYPSNDADFLANEADLRSARKFFRRIEHPLPADGPVVVCFALPQAMRVALAVHHDRDGNHRFGFMPDGVGFGRNPRLRWRKPRSAEASVFVPSTGGHARVVLNYECGLGMRPLGECQR